MTESLLNLPTHLRRRLASALESGLIQPPCNLASVQSALGSLEHGEEIVSALIGLEELGISGPASAAWLRTLESTVARIAVPDLVWSGPDIPGVYARDTRRVFEEVLGSAEHSIWACTYAYFDGPKAFNILARRMDETPDLRVILMLNIQRQYRDTTSADQLVRNFADRFWSTDWPGTSKPKVYYDPRSLELGSPTGVLHAKALVADEEVVFVTSANFTEAALDRNIELGLLVRDRALSLSMSSHFRGLIDKQLLLPLPAE